MKKYNTIVFMQGDDYHEWEAVAYPDREGVSLGWVNEKAGLEYLKQWDYGEPGESHDNDPTQYDMAQSFSEGQYVMTWHTGLCYVALDWRNDEAE